MRRPLHLALPLAAAVSVLAAIPAALAADGASRTDAGVAAPGRADEPTSSVRRALGAIPAARGGRVLLEGAATAQLAPGEVPGFAYCGNDVAYVWPADAPSHDATITRTYAIASASGTFSDPVVDPSPYYVVQVGPDYSFWGIAAQEVVYGPTVYADAWFDPDLSGNVDYVAFVNEVTTLDGAAASTEYALVEAFGPSEVGTSNVCRP